MKKYLDFIFEVGFLRKVMRSQRLSLDNSIAEHSYRVIMIAYVLAKELKADLGKVLAMAMVHDLPETRVGDLDRINKKYLFVEDEKIFQEQVDKLPFSKDLVELYEEYKAKKTLEAKIVRDADILEEVFSEKELIDSGVKDAKEWIKYSVGRLKLPLSKKIAKQAVKHNSRQWWYQLLP